MDSVIEKLKYVCGYYSLFILEKKYEIYVINNCLICNSIILELLTPSYIDYYAISNNDICLCLTYSRLLLLKNQPKFRILNGLPYIDCQLYPPMLADLSIAKKVVIAYVPPVVFILKLKPSEVFNLIAYSRIKGHIVLFL